MDAGTNRGSDTPAKLRSVASGQRVWWRPDETLHAPEWEGRSMIRDVTRPPDPDC